MRAAVPPVLPGTAAPAATRPRRGLRARIQAWWMARHPPVDTWTLTQHNVYILPTRAGWMFALTLLVMLVSSINYQLNLGYVLTFLLAGAGLVSIHLTHATLRGLTLRLRPLTPVFVGENAALEVVLSNPGGARHGIGLHLSPAPRGPRLRPAAGGPAGRGESAEPSMTGRRQDAQIAWCDVPAQGQASARLTIAPQRRGWHAVPVLVVETRFPFGLFRAWSLWRPAAQVLAWPAPERPAPPLPALRSTGGEPRPVRSGAGGEFDGVREWRRGDSLRQVLWKKAARVGEMVSRDTASESRRELWLDWLDTRGAGDAETRLSRLCAWVLEADRQGLLVGLRLAGRVQPVGRGEAHRRDLLRELALWP